MAGINYPDSFDTFYEPVSPAETPLSQSGTSNAGKYNRNHFQHHRDLGDAVEQLERTASQRDHDHSGDTSVTPGGVRSGSKLKQVNTHEEHDADKSSTALHHTLGPGRYQAAAGNHNHNYVDLIGVPYLPCTSSTRPLNPDVGMMIFEKDTGQMRLWSAFSSNTVVSGLSSVDNFDRSGPDNLGPSLWEQWYDWPSPPNGKMFILDSNSAYWSSKGSRENRCVARRINPADSQTQGDDQVVTWKSGSEEMEIGLPPIQDWGDILKFYERMSTNDVYLRMSANRQSYIRIKYAYSCIFVYYTLQGKTYEKPVGVFTDVPMERTGFGGLIKRGIADTEWRAEIKNYTLTVHQDGVPVGSMQVPDTSARGVSNRGWGFGMQVGPSEFLGFPISQHRPVNVDWIKIQDSLVYQAQNRWTLLPLASLPVCRLHQTAPQKLVRTGTIVEWNVKDEDTNNFFNASDRRSIVCREPGVYHVDVAIQWDPQIVPDIAHVVLLINGVETDARQDQYMSSKVSAPGFSQTLPLSAKVRVGTGDVLTVKVSYVATENIWDDIWSYCFLEQASKVYSRIQVSYLSP